MRRLALFCASGLAALWLGARLFAAEDPAAAFDAANKLYEQGRFPAAADAYTKLIQSGPAAPALHFNLGNAFFKSGQLGRALVAYRRAEALAPRDPELRANLQFVRNQVQGPTLPPNRWPHWLGTLTLNEWTVLAAAALWLWLGLLVLLQWRPKWKPALRSWIYLSGIGAGLLGLCLAAVLYASRSDRLAMVIAPNAVVHNGPLEESPEAFTLHDGAEVAVLDLKDNWLQITAGKNRNGWVRREHVELPGLPESAPAKLLALPGG